MSLINQMLSDLEQRHSHVPDQDPLVLGGLSPIDDTGFRGGDIPYNFLIVCFFTTAVIGAAYGLLPGNGNIRPADPEDSLMTTPVLSVATGPGVSPADGPAERDYEIPAAANHATISPPSGLKLDLSLSVADNPAPAGSDAPTQVREITLETAGEMSHLQLSLDRHARYAVYSLTNPDRAVLELTGVRLDAPVPDVAGHPYIQRFRYSSRAGGRFVLVADSILPVTIEGSRLDEREDGVLLTVRMSAKDTGLADAAPAAQVSAKREQAVTDRLAVKTSATGPGGNTERLLGQARMHYAAGAYHEADEKIQALMKEDPLHVQGRLAYFSSLVKRGDNAAAARVLEAGLKVSPGVAEWAKVYARMLVNQGQTSRAVGILAAALPDIEADAEYYAFYAALLQRLSRHAEAAEFYGALLQRHDSNGLWWMGQAISLDALRQVPEALQSYRNALADESLDLELRQYILQQIGRLSG